MASNAPVLLGVVFPSSFTTSKSRRIHFGMSPHGFVIAFPPLFTAPFGYFAFLESPPRRFVRHDFSGVLGLVVSSWPLLR